MQLIRSQRRAAAALSALIAAAAIAGCGGSNTARSSTTASANTGLKYSQCVRAHGVPDFPDPRSAGNAESVVISSTYAKAGGKLLSESPQVVQTATDKCQRYSPDSRYGPIYTASQMAELRAGELVYAKCMRAHGIDYPDPIVTRGPGGHGFAYGLPSNELLKHPLDVRSPAYQSANRTCGERWYQVRKQEGLS